MFFNNVSNFVSQGACVQNVLDSLVVSLLRDPNRKFVYAEMVKIREINFNTKREFKYLIYSDSDYY